METVLVRAGTIVIWESQWKSVSKLKTLSSDQCKRKCTLEITCINEQWEIPKGSPIKNLDPFLDDQGLLRVGRRIGKANLSQAEKNQLIVPGQHHVAGLIVKHYHEQTRHQGQLFAEGAVRTAGWWIVVGKKKVSCVIHHCVRCRRLRTPSVLKKWPISRHNVFQLTPHSQMWAWMCLSLHNTQGEALSKPKDGLSSSHVWAWGQSISKWSNLLIHQISSAHSDGSWLSGVWWRASTQIVALLLLVLVKTPDTFKHKQCSSQNIPVRTGIFMDFQSPAHFSFWGCMGEDGGPG